MERHRGLLDVEWVVYPNPDRYEDHEDGDDHQRYFCFLFHGRGLLPIKKTADLIVPAGYVERHIQFFRSAVPLGFKSYHKGKTLGLHPF